MIGIVVSLSDRVADRIRDELLAITDWYPHEDDSRSPADGGGTYHSCPGAVLRTVETTHLHLENAGRVFDADLDRIVFPSRHAGDTGALLTTHFTGNVASADHGGTDRELAEADPRAGKRALRSLDRHAPEGYDVSLECTHHGPSAVGVPSLYVELGSGESQWSDEAAARAVARAVLACREVAPADGDSAQTDAKSAPIAADSGSDADPPVPLPGHRLVGFGGGHYAPRLTRIARETSWAVGHVAADWGLDAWSEPDPAVVEQVFERSGATVALLEGERPALATCIEDRGYRIVSETWLRASSGVALSLVDRCEDRLCPVADGLRFGTPARARSQALARSSGFDAETLFPSSATVWKPPAELLEAAAGIDLERTRTAVARHAIAFETTEAGNRPSGRTLLGAPQVAAAMIDALATVLEERYDRIERTAEAVVAERSVFDPDRAATLGVPEGPAFGRLAAGETVTVDGRDIDPDVVTTTERRRFQL